MSTTTVPTGTLTLDRVSEATGKRFTKTVSVTGPAPAFRGLIPATSVAVSAVNAAGMTETLVLTAAEVAAIRA